jgi:hypothetical protein
MLVWFEVLAAVNTKLAIFWAVIVGPELSRWLTALMMEAVRPCETLVNSYQATQHYNRKDSHLWYDLVKVSILKEKRTKFRGVSLLYYVNYCVRYSVLKYD